MSARCHRAQTAELTARTAGPVVSGCVEVERAVGRPQVGSAAEAFGRMWRRGTGEREREREVGGGLKHG